MRVLHTSDWHIGRPLYCKRRHAEFEEFFAWLADTLRQERVDLLLVAGDVFDNGAPSPQSQEIYYRFLRRLAASGCRHAVVVAGNHDSPAFLNAPKEILKILDIHVVGQISDDPEDEVITLLDASGAPEAIVCAVPHLRDRDVRRVLPGESVADKNRRLLEGISAHYAAVTALAAARRSDLEAGLGPGFESGLPLIVTGHLFAAGGQVEENDGTRELYVGALARVGADAFPPEIDYLALGHLHSAQLVAGDTRLRYSGAPLQLSFGEAARQKSVILAEFAGRRLQEARILPVPVFQNLERVSGKAEVILQRLVELKASGRRAWLELILESAEGSGGFVSMAQEALADSGLELLGLRQSQAAGAAGLFGHTEENLADLDEFEVFERCLEAHKVPEAERASLRQAYAEIAASLRDPDLPPAPKAEQRHAHSGNTL